MRSQVLWIAAALACGCTGAAAAQTAAPAARSSLAETERAQLVRAVTADPRIRSIVGERPRVIVGEPVFDKAQLERYSRIEDAPVPARQVPLILFNAQTNRAARAVATADGRIVRVDAIPAVLVPFTEEDAALALDLVRRNAANRIPNLERFVIETGNEPSRAEYVAEILPLRSSAAYDPCSKDRCVDVIFRTPAGYLRLRPHVDLTRRTVQFGGPQR